MFKSSPFSRNISRMFYNVCLVGNKDEHTFIFKGSQQSIQTTYTSCFKVVNVVDNSKGRSRTSFWIFKETSCLLNSVHVSPEKMSIFISFPVDSHRKHDTFIFFIDLKSRTNVKCWYLFHLEMYFLYLCLASWFYTFGDCPFCKIYAFILLLLACVVQFRFFSLFCGKS